MQSNARSWLGAGSRWLAGDRARPDDPAAAVRHLPAGQRVYAIGDVHGRLDLLEPLIGRIERDCRTRSMAETTIVLLGDLIDRGPQSSNVIELAASWNASWAKLKVLRGNHEALLLLLLEGKTARLNRWLLMGGAETLASYGLSEEEMRSLHVGALIAEARRRIPERHLAFLRSLPTHWRLGDYFFVHAGVRPGAPLDDQRSRDLLAIRSDFLDSEDEHGALVIHGHSTDPMIDQRHNRIGIDTGAWRTGELSAVGLQGSDRWFLSERLGGPGPCIDAETA